MISDNQLDELFKDRLRDYPSSVPADIWDRILKKRKRDRMLWMFFGLLSIGILALGLTGSYFIFNQKKSATDIAMDQAKINHKPLTNNDTKAGQSNLSPAPVQIASDNSKAEHNKMHQKEKARIAYSTNLGHGKKDKSGNYNLPHDEMKTPAKVNSNPNENKSGALVVTSATNEIEKNKTESKKDSITTKPLTASIDSSGTTDLKKPGTKKNPDNGKWFLDVYVSPDYPIVSPPENVTSKLSYTLGARINRSLGKHFSVKTGIQFSRINFIANDSLFGGVTTHLMRLDLPVLAGYSIGDENLRTTFNGGAIVNIYTWPQGNNLTEFFKTNTGFSLYLGVNFEKRIDEKIFLFTEPYYRYQLTSMTVNSVSSLKFIDIVGISIGARYYFTK